MGTDPQAVAISLIGLFCCNPGGEAILWGIRLSSLKGPTMRALSILFAAAVAFHSSMAGFAQADHHSTPEKLGSVSFSTSCSAVVQLPFNRAVALMHSFQFASAIDAFRGVLSTDPSCSMAYWGIALSNWGNPFAAGVKA